MTVFVLVGCSRPAKTEPIWKQFKITDFAEPNDSNSQQGRLLKTINFDIYVFEIPAEKIDSLEPVWDLLFTRPLHFNNLNAFKANSFLAGVGEGKMWDSVGDQLRIAKAKEEELASLLLFNGQPDDVFVADLDIKQDIFYISAEGATEGVSLGPGSLVLRIQADKVPAVRGVCNVTVQPAFPATNKSVAPQLDVLQESNEFLFTAAGFKVMMSPGQFIFLGPQKYNDDRMTLGSLFFSIPQNYPIVRAYLIVCKDIIE